MAPLIRLDGCPGGSESSLGAHVGFVVLRIIIIFFFFFGLCVYGQSFVPERAACPLSFFTQSCKNGLMLSSFF